MHSQALPVQAAAKSNSFHDGRCAVFPRRAQRSPGCYVQLEAGLKQSILAELRMDLARDMQQRQQQAGCSHATFRRSHPGTG